jgi:hypothetical protein
MKKSKVDLGFPIGEVCLLSLYENHGVSCDVFCDELIISSACWISSVCFSSPLQIFSPVCQLWWQQSAAKNLLAQKICPFSIPQLQPHGAVPQGSYFFDLLCVLSLSFWRTLGNGLGVCIWFTSHPHHWQLPQPVNKLLLNLLLLGFQGKLAKKFHQITACFVKTHVAVTLFLFSFSFHVMANFWPLREKLFF